MMVSSFMVVVEFVQAWSGIIVGKAFQLDCVALVPSSGGFDDAMIAFNELSV